MQRHSPTLFSLPEHSQHGLNGEQDGGQELSQWSSTRLHLSTYSRTPTHSPTPFPAVTTPNSAQGSKYSYFHFIKRYHSLPGESEEDGRDDTDGNYLLRRSGRFTDAQDSEDEERPGSSHGGESRDKYSSLLLDSDIYEPVTPGERERLEWQSMLASVLDGEVLKSEKTRIQNVLESSSEEANNRYFRIWIGLRARLRGRKEEEEKRRLEERRRHIVDPVVQEIFAFRVDDGPCSPNTLQQVNTVLRRLDIVQSLYPSLKAFHLDRPLVAEAEFQTRCDVLNSWSTVLTSLRQQIDLLRKWTGSDTLDVSQPNTNPEKPIGSREADTIPQVGSGEHLDGSTFIERLLKQESIQRVFGKKGILAKVNALVNIARGTQLNFAGLFQQLNLPKLELEVVQLVWFPTELIRACLRMRLDYAVKVKDPEVLIIDQLLDDFQLTIRLACKVKREYEEFYRPDPNGNWTLPKCISDDFDSVVLEAVMFFFKLLNWKLKSAARDIYFRETDVLEAHWATFNDVGLTINGGTSVIAEQICILTNKVMVRVTTTFERQVRLPTTGKEKPVAPFTPPRRTDSPSGGPGHGYEFHNRYGEGSNKAHARPMTNEQRVSFYSRMLESVKPRYGKLQRFIRTLTQRFTNCAEYSLETMPLDPFIAGLIEADHFLVYTQSFEEEGTYIVASRALRDRPEAIRQMLSDAFHVNGLWDNVNVNPVPRLEGSSSPTESADDESIIDDSAYILVLSPRMRFLWTGLVLMLAIPKFNLDLKDNRIRLVADGPGVRLDLAKQRFTELFAPLDADEPEIETFLPPPACLVDRMAHLPSVNREVRKIIRVSNRLAEAVVDSIPYVRSSLAGLQDCSELLESWFSFASDTGQHAQKHMDRLSWIKFNRSLIRLAISWVSFICDECDPTHQKTFRWAVTALEFTMLRTKRNNILHIPDDQFNLLRQKVASCMTLLISHYDILGARSTLEAKQERDTKEELVRQQAFDAIYTAEEEEFLRSFTLEDPVVKGSVTTKPTQIGDRSVRKYREAVMKALSDLEEKRAGLGYEQHLLGRVLDVEKPEDRSLMFLASSSSNISIRWQQGKFIGAGAFGSVYMAVNLESGSIMAVKEIRYQEVPGISNFLQQIKDELRIMELLHHPNIVEYYGIEVHRDKIYIFEEYCEGGSLADNLDVGRIQDEHILQVYTMQMLEGLSYLHSQNIVHRDIKPDNILLDHLGVLKFVDFGAAKILAKNTRTVQRSRVISMNGSSQAAKPAQALGGGLGMNNSLTGTPMYMSPEVIKNDKRGRRGAMDIWSMGCVVLECATGRKPWSNLDNEWAIMFHIGVATQHPPLPDKGELSEKGIHFIKQCLTIDPVLRPTADELMEHPWMLDFMETLREYEEEEMASPPTEIPSEKDFKGAAVARHAAIIQEKEVEAITATSPPTSEVTTPPV